MRIIFIILVSIAVIGFIFKGDDKLNWRVEFNEDDAERIATIALMQGGIKGCGSLKVDIQFVGLHEIQVICDPEKNAKAHYIQWWPEFKVDGRPLAENPMDKTWIGKAYCIKTEDEKWHAAYLDLRDAQREVVALSEFSDKSARIFLTESSYFYYTEKNEGGSWGLNMSEEDAATRSDRRGCELR